MSQRREKKIRRQMRAQECGCGRPLTEEAWAELERRVLGE